MCGIFGAISPEISNRAEFNQFINELMKQSARRGRDATGFASIVNDEFITDKHAVDSIDFSKLNREWRRHSDAHKMQMIGHTRAATAGSPKFNENNHPFHGPRYTIAHNGGVWQHRKFAEEQGFDLKTDCDSEVILHFLEKHEKLEDGIIDALAEMDSMAMMAVCILERDTGNIHLFRTSSSPCSVFRVERWNAVVFASTPQIICRSAANTLGSMGTVQQELEMVYAEDSDGDIPAYSHVTITPNGEITVKNLQELIAAQSGRSPKGRGNYSRYGGYGWIDDDDVEVFNGGRSKFEGDRAPSKSSLENTAIMITCPKCKEALEEPINGDVCVCKCGFKLTRNLTSSTQKDKATTLDSGDKFPPYFDVYDVMPPGTKVFEIEDLIDYLDGIRSTGDETDRYQLSDEDVGEYLSCDMMSIGEKILNWEDMTDAKILMMGDGEYLAFYTFVEECVALGVDARDENLNIKFGF
jgi:glutamine amidotransferase-like protein